MKRNIFLFLILFLAFFTLSFVYAEDIAQNQTEENTKSTVNDEVVSEPVILTENILIRNGEKIIYDGSFNLPGEGSVEIFDNALVAHNVDSRSVLGILYALDQSSENFSISNLQYYDSFGAFYLKCMLNSTGEEFCDNWQYVVNGAVPSAGADATILSGGESVGLFFGNSHQIIFNSPTINTSESLIAITQKYNYLDNGWSALAGVTVGVTTPNIDDPWNPKIISENSVDENGQATISFSEVGNYNLGIKEDFYFPSYSIVVTAPVINGGGGGRAWPPPAPVFSIPSAISFLSSQQKEDGSFGEILYTDWVSVAITSIGSDGDTIRQRLYEYEKNLEYDSNIVTDSERHAMALMSLGINPYSDTKINYIKKIADSFDGTQFGDSSLINDDIFALIVLNNAGYNLSDEFVLKDILYISSKQLPNGSWGSVDLTSAGIQALEPFEKYGDVSERISKAENYLIKKIDEGIDNSFSASWALQVIDDAGLKQHLINKQQDDGGVEPTTNMVENRIWATAYAIPAILHKPWSEIMQKFPKQEIIIALPPTLPLIKREAPKVERVVKKTENKKIINMPEEEKMNNLQANVASAVSNNHPFRTFFSRIFQWFIIKLKI